MARSWRMLCVLLAVLVLPWGGGANAAERWWRPVVPEVLFEEDCADRDLSGWGAVSGQVEAEAEPASGARYLMVERAATAAVAGEDWPDYVLETSFRFRDAQASVRIAVCTDGKGGVYAIEAEGSADGAKVDLRVLAAGQVAVSDSLWLRAEEAEEGAGWQEQWFAVRVEVSAEAIWFYFNGRAIASAPAPETARGGIRLTLPAGTAVRPVRVTKLTRRRGGFLPVNLTGYYNNHAVVPADATISAGLEPNCVLSPEGLPAGGSEIIVHGIPFRWGSDFGGPDDLDIGPSGLRLYTTPTWMSENPDNSAMDGDPRTIILRLPRRFYTKMYVLCASDTSTSEVPRFTIRQAPFGGRYGAEKRLPNTVVDVPAWNEPAGPGKPKALPVKLQGNGGDENGPANLWLVEIPLKSGTIQDIVAAEHFTDTRGPITDDMATRSWIDMDLTRDLATQLAVHSAAPLGAGSAVHILALTLVESPIKMVVTSKVIGHIFTGDQVPTFQVLLENVTAQDQYGSLLVTTRDYYGNSKQDRLALAVPAGQKVVKQVEAPQDVLGLFDISLRLQDADGQDLLERKTTFALLPPDTRTAERDSPFGLWSWGGGHYTPSNKAGAELMRKAGARWTTYTGKEQWGVWSAAMIPHDLGDTLYSEDDQQGKAREFVDNMRRRKSSQSVEPSTVEPRYWLLYWEAGFGGGEGNQYPPSILGRPPIELDEQAKTRFDQMWQGANACAQLARKELPDAKLALGTIPAFIQAFLERGFPREYLGAISVELQEFGLSPERPPSRIGLQALYWVQEWKRMYGYEDLGLILIESMFRPTGPGGLTERTQADYYVRSHLLGLAYGVELFGNCANLCDVGNVYHHSQYGTVGLCHRAPELNPKESFVAYATMTSVLDRAEYLEYLDTGSTSVWALRFRDRDGRNVYALWTINGQRDLTLELSGDAAAVVIDAMYNQRPVSRQGRKAQLTVSSSPVYLRTGLEITSIEPEPARYSEAPPRNARSVTRLDDLTQWQIVTERDEELETNFGNCPRRPGNFEYAIVADPTHGNVLQVTALPTEGHALMPMYGVLRSTSGVPLPGKPTRLGFWAKGNSCWGRLIIELTDAEGERWLSILSAPEQPWMPDAANEHFISFDGWRWVEFGLPGNIPLASMPLPDHYFWGPLGGDRNVDYPLTLTRLIIELRDQVVHVNELVPVPDNRVCFSDLMVIE